MPTLAIELASLCARRAKKPSGSRVPTTTPTRSPSSVSATTATAAAPTASTAACDMVVSGELNSSAVASVSPAAVSHGVIRRFCPWLGVLLAVDLPARGVRRPRDLEQRPVRLFHDWLVDAGL